MVVFNCHIDMSSTTKSASTKAATLPPGTSNSEFSRQQWLDLLRVLPPSSRTNLQLALKQYLDETSQGDGSETQTLNVQQSRKVPLPDASTLVQTATAIPNVPHDDMPQNTFGTDRYLTLLRQSLDLDRKPLIPSPNNMLATPSLDPLNGLDTLAAAALANTNSETNVTSSPAVAVLQGKPVPGTGMVAIPITAQMAPALLGGFKPDLSQRQSPTIRETPKRLAATRAEAEQAAAASVGPSPPIAAVHYTAASADVSKRSRITPETVDDVDNSAATTNLLLSNGAMSSGAAPTPALKPDPENISTAYHYHPTADAQANWSVQHPTASSSVSTDNSRRRCRDEGITDDEVARREKRRERNRVAAAKCRQNRQNQIEDLKARRKILEDEGTQTRQLIQNLLHEKAQLEELLKKHAHNGCPTAAQYFQNGTLLLRLTGSTTPGACCSTPSIRIIQPTNSSPQIAPAPPPIKQEGPSQTPVAFVPAQRPNTLPLVTSAKLDTPTLDSATSLAAQLWSPSVAAKIKTPGGESWVNSQIGLPPVTAGLKLDKDNGTSAATAAAAAILSTPDLLHQLGISLAGASTPTKAIQITVTNPTTSGVATDSDIKVTSAS
uniref:BZIP domain-containing protein n=1 Tax=Mesocestoides corti TaxID=53468 RepID=A0A5K3ETY5_MESCO